MITKPVKENINADVNARWGNSESFAARAAEATPDSLLRDIVADSRRGLAPRSALSEPKRQYPQHPVETIPNFQEWYFQRYGSVISEDKAKNWYHTEKTAGRGVGKGPMPQSAVGSVPRNGWVQPAPIGPPPGIAQLDRLLDHQDRLDRLDRAKTGKW